MNSVSKMWQFVFSTHQMEQGEKMCDNICLITKGNRYEWIH